MPHLTINNVSLYYEDSSPISDKPVMLFAHGLLWSTRLFDQQIAYFKDQFRCIAFDFRGQGRSEVTKSGYDMDTLAADAIGLLDALGIDRCHFVGLSMGGFVGQRVAIHHPNRLYSLVLLETSAEAEDPLKVPQYSKLIKAIKWLGVKRVSKKIMPILFGQSVLADKSRRSEYQQWLNYLHQNDKVGAVRATKGVIRRQGVLDQLGKITTPTLVVVGDEDVATPYDKAQKIHFAINGSKLALIKGAGHSSPVEAPDQVNQIIKQFIDIVK